VRVGLDQPVETGRLDPKYKLKDPNALRLDILPGKRKDGKRTGI